MNLTKKKWQVSELTKGLAGLSFSRGLPEKTIITSLSLDSRTCREGALFIALKGAVDDGQCFIEQAAEKGASAVLTDMELRYEIPEKGLCLIQSKNPEHAAGLIAARFYGAQPEYIAAVTGTNGKTSVAHFCRQIWHLMGMQSACIGTVGVFVGDEKNSRESGLTTPDVLQLHRILKGLAEEEVTHLCMEASSHGLVQERLAGVRVRVGAFTNLTHDHLDYHGTMESYLKAKLKLFSDVMEESGTAVLNADDPAYKKFEKVCKKRGHNIISYGRKGKDITLLEAEAGEGKQHVRLRFFGKEIIMQPSLLGEFQIYNLLCAMGVVHDRVTNISALSQRKLGSRFFSAGLDASLRWHDTSLYEAIRDAAQKVKPVHGRMEVVATRCGAPIVVDYAHTPDALKKVLEALRPYAKNRLVVVFGCGGNRDAGKRPEMGRIANELADIIIVTDDNPRHEDAAVIRRQILATCPNAKEIGDRAEAIRYAMSLLEKGDVLLVAGKGHETGQIVGNETLPFDDTEVIRKSL